TDRALEMLQEYAGGLRESALDPDRVALLRRPVESRLQQFKMLKAQKDFEKEQIGQHATAASMQSRIALAEQNKQKNVADLMKQYNTLFKEAKYEQAEMAALKAHDLDPDNPVPSAALYTAKTMKNQIKYKDIKDRKEQGFDNDLDDAEDRGPSVNSGHPVDFDVAVTQRNRRERHPWGPIKINDKSPRELEKQKEIEHRLSLPVTFKFKDTPLEQVIYDLKTL